MTSHSGDITKTLISADYIMNNIYSLFPDSVLLNKNFQILGMSPTVCHSLGYTINEMVGKSISSLEQSGGLETVLRERLKGGYFNDELLSILTRSCDVIRFSVSGFYLGLLMECSDVVVLRFISRHELEDIDRKLHQTKKHIYRLIYRTAHDLRGPLTNIQGLVCLLKLQKNDAEVDRFLHLMEEHYKKLDDRLHQLISLAQADEEKEEPIFEARLSELETELREILNEMHVLFFWNRLFPDRTLL